MAPVDAAMTVLHLLFGAAWTGGVLFMAVAVLPAATSGDVDPRPLSVVTGRLKLLSRASAAMTLLTGGYLAGTLYDVAGLTGTAGGNLVLAMLGLWVALMAAVEVAADRLATGVADADAATAARETRPLFYAAAAVAVLLLVVGGVLVA